MSITYEKTEDHNFPYCIGNDETDEVIGMIKTEKYAKLIATELNYRLNLEYLESLNPFPNE